MITLTIGYIWIIILNKNNLINEVCDMLGFVKNNKYVIVACVILLAGGFGGYKYYEGSKAPVESVRLGTITKGALTSSVSATGSLSAVDNVDISSKITGRIVKVYVEENQHVDAGDVLVELDDTALKATLAQAQAKLDKAAADYTRYSGLVEQGAISEASFDAYRSEYLVAKSNYERAASDVQDTVITSPISGYIIGKPTPEGQTISSGISQPQVIMSVANLDDMQIETLVDESDIGQVKAGQKVNFTVDAYPDETFTGTVRLVSRKAVTENNVIYYTVYVNVDDAKGKLLPTMTARTDIIIDKVEDALLVPQNCIHWSSKKTFVKVYNEKTKESRDVEVTVGLSDENDVVVSAPELQEGDKVMVRKVVAKQAGNKMGPH